MTKVSFFLLLAGMGLQACDTAQSAKIVSDSQLVWSDEFEGEALDRSKWTPELSCWGGGNKERQCYVDSPENISVKDGVLTLTARKQTHSGYEMAQDNPDRGRIVTQGFTSAKVRTKNLADWTYGRFEARIKLPKGQSTWPAFWMLPQTETYGGWPNSGEIDIMEAVNLGAACETCVGGEENRSMGALHFGRDWPENEFHVETFDLSRNSLEAWHIYSVNWREGLIEWSVNDQVFFSLTEEDWFTPTTKKTDNPNAPFDHPFYLILNLAVGGNLPDGRNEGDFNPNSFPAEMKVDWVRVYN